MSDVFLKVLKLSCEVSECKPLVGGLVLPSLARVASFDFDLMFESGDDAAAAAAATGDIEPCALHTTAGSDERNGCLSCGSVNVR